MSDDLSGARTVFLHVGSPKTGTTYLQDVLHRHRGDLRHAGVLYPGKGNRAHFLAALDLRGIKFAGFEDPDVPGSWEQLSGEMRSWPGVSLFSHEVLAGAEESEIVTAVNSFGDADVHVIITARDLARQIPSMWQESIKNRQTTPWTAYIEMLRDAAGEDAPPGQRTPGHRFWRAQDAADIAARWGKQVGSDHVHLVTVRSAAGGTEELWTRFASVVGIDPTVFHGRIGKPNPALGVVETELLRRLNERVADTMVWPTYRAHVKHRLAENVLVRTQLRGPLRLPPDQRGWADQWSRALVAQVGDSGVDVVGELRDLLPSYPEEEQAYSPEEVTDADTFEAASPAIIASVRGLVGMVATSKVERQEASPPRLRTRMAGRLRRVRLARLTLSGLRKAETPPLGLPPRVFVHVGLPKTGTTHLQAVMSANRKALRGDGFLYPAGRFGGHFFAALDVMDRSFRGHRYPAAEGTWRDMTQQLLAFGRAGLISHEVLFAATEQDIVRIARSLAGAEVHVVITARDLGRQLPAVWQEQIKLGHTYNWKRFIEAVKAGRNDPVSEAPPEGGGAAEGDSTREHTGGGQAKELPGMRDLRRVSAQFWRGRDCSAVARRWATVLPPERIHVVTVPPTGADEKLLWRRFAAVLGLDPDRYDPPDRGANTSLGPAETEVMRRLNPELRRTLTWEQYERHAKWDLAERVLAARQQSGRMGLPSRHAKWVRARSERIIADLREGGYAIAGELDDLLPARRPRSSGARDPDQTDDSEIAVTAVDALIGLARLYSKRSLPPTPTPVVPDAAGGLRGRLRSASRVRFPRRATLGRVRRATASKLQSGGSGE
jgi:hypothetical protein